MGSWISSFLSVVVKAVIKNQEHAKRKRDRHDQQPAKHIKLFLLRCCLWDASSLILLDLL